MTLQRRGFLRGIIAAAAAPAIITTPGLLMPIKPLLTVGNVPLVFEGLVLEFDEAQGSDALFVNSDLMRLMNAVDVQDLWIYGRDAAYVALDMSGDEA